MSGRIVLPPDVANLLARLHRAGYTAYVVGGCVRDCLRHVDPHDWDVTTAATPEEILSVFSDHRTVTVGAQHGTIAVLTDLRTVEVTTFRVEGTYADRRRPNDVRFVADIREDLCRRDFTVNAMAYNDREGLIDPLGGRQDLADGCIRAVGDAATRFSEDALRILRALRFAAVLDFSVEEKTAAALHNARALLKEIAVERISAELIRLLCGKNAAAVLREFRDVIGVVLPEIVPLFDFEQHNPYHLYDVYEHTLHALQNAPADPWIRWAVLLHDVGKPQTFTLDENGVGHFYGHAAVSAALAAQACKRLRLDNETQQTVVELIAAHDHPLLPTETAVKRALNKFGEEQLRRLLTLKYADNAALSHLADGRKEELQQVEALMNDLLLMNACFSLKDLCVKGNDVTELGVPSGPAVGKVLNTLLDEVINGICPNEREPLLQRAEELMSKGGYF